MFGLKLSNVETAHVLANSRHRATLSFTESSFCPPPTCYSKIHSSFSSVLVSTSFWGKSNHINCILVFTLCRSWNRSELILTQLTTDCHCCQTRTRPVCLILTRPRTNNLGCLKSLEDGSSVCALLSVTVGWLPWQFVPWWPTENMEDGGAGDVYSSSRCGVWELSTSQKQTGDIIP